jgi:hypothetical protein
VPFAAPLAHFLKIHHCPRAPLPTSLKGNRIGDPGAASLAEMLMKNQTIHTLV